MRRVLVCGSVVLLASVVPQLLLAAVPLRPNRKAVSFAADVVTLVDDLGRYVVLVDTDRNGSVEHAILYEASGPLPPEVRKFRGDTRVLYAGDSSPRRVEIAHLDHGSVEPIVQLDLDGKDRSGGTRHDRLHGGIALAQVSGYGLWPDADRTAPEVLRLRGLPTFDEAETEHIRTSRSADDPLVQAVFEACSCKDCSSGGVGATSCNIKCQGRLAIVDVGEDCNVQCGAGFYACCTCRGLFAAFGRCECVAN